AKLDQILGLAVDRHRFADAARRVAVLARRNRTTQSADRLEYVDCGILPGSREPPRQDDVSVQNGSDSIADRLVEVVAFYQYGKETCDGSLPEVAGPLANLRQKTEDRRRIPLLTGRFAGGQADLALRHGQPCDRVHDEQDVFALVTEILRDGERDKARTDAQGRRTVRSRADDDGALHAFRTKIVF